LRLTGRSLSRRGLAAARGPEAQKIVVHLGKAVASSAREPGRRPIDDVHVPPACLVSLAVT